MPTKRRLRMRQRAVQLGDSELSMLVSGFDMFGEFHDENAERALHQLWTIHGEHLCAEHVEIDCTTRPAAWWWFSAPEIIRVAFRQQHGKTQQRNILLRVGILKGKAAELARKKLDLQRKAAVPEVVFDLRDS